MGYWGLMLVLVLIIPCLMIYFGRGFYKKGAPKNINTHFGYRTTRSMQNWYTWDFAHRKFGKLISFIGLIMIPVSAALISLTVKLQPDAQTIIAVIIMGAQSLLLIVPIVITEKQLKTSFDEKGNRTPESLEKEEKAAQEKADKKQAKENKSKKAKKK